MDNQTQPNISPSPSTVQSSIPPPANWIKASLLFCLGTFIIIGSIFTGIQIGKKQKTDNSPKTQQTILIPSEIPTVQQKIVPTIVDCSTFYSSKYLDLSFKYDKCIWNIDEQSTDPDSGKTYPILITALYKNSPYKILIKAENIGMGGGYPGCEKVDDIKLLEKNIVRVKIKDNNYHYLNEKNDYAIKDGIGQFGNSKFNEYFKFLNPTAFPNVNMCWRQVGINPVNVLNPGQGEKAKDVTLSIEENILDNSFLNNVDILAVNIFTSLEK